MDNSIPMTLTFFLLVTTIYALLSTLHIHSPTTSFSTTLYEPRTHESTPPTNTSAEFLFRIANLHVYGNRSLFIAVVVGGSLFAATGVIYWVLALTRGLVKWDASEQWRQTSRLADTSSRDDLQHNRTVVIEGASSASIIAKARNSYLSSSEKQSIARFRPDGAHAGPSRSSGIPSYYFKEHDDEGRSVIDGMQSSSGMRSPMQKDSLGFSGRVGGGHLPPLGGGTATGAEWENNKADYRVTRSLPGSAREGESGRRRHVQGTTSSIASDSVTGIANWPAGQAGQARRNSDDTWDAVYCSGMD
jgi:hypothetical protein